MKKIKIILFTVFGLSLVSCITMTNAADMDNGKTVFNKWCLPCHGDGPGYPGTAALAAKYNGEIPAVLQSRKDMTEDFVKLFVRQGVSIMPFFRKTEITDSELNNLAAYLSSKK